MKYVIAVVWLLAALGVLGLRSSPGIRMFFAYAGSIVAFVHLFALILGLWGEKVGRKPVEQGPAVGGFLIGIALGIAVGAAFGVLASRNTPFYVAVQFAAAGFLIFLPLFRL